MGGTEGSGMLFLIGNNLQVLFFKRLFLDPIASVGYFSDDISYVNGKPKYASQQAGSNDSDKNDYITGDGWDNYIRMNFKYQLPIGTGKDHIISVYKLDRGLLFPSGRQDHPDAEVRLTQGCFYRRHMEAAGRMAQLLKMAPSLREHIRTEF